MPPGKGLSEETSIPQHSPCREDCSIPRWKSHYSSFPCPTSTPNPRGNSFLGFFALIKSGTTIHLNEVTAAQQSSAPVLGSTSPLHVIDVIAPKNGGKKGERDVFASKLWHLSAWPLLLEDGWPSGQASSSSCSCPVGVCAPQPMQQLQMAWLFNISSASATTENPQSSFVSASLNLLEWKVYPE